MKKVIRQNVFETNSSSTHSLTIKRNDISQEIDKNSSFEIRSPIAKVVWLLGHIDSAESQFEYQLKEEKNNGNDIRIKKEIIKDIQEYMPELIQELNDQYAGDILANADTIDLHDKLIDMGCAVFSYGSGYNYLNTYEDVCFLRRLKEALINTYAEIENISIDQAMENIKHEAFGLSRDQRDKFLNPATREKMVKQAKEVDYLFREIFNKHKNKPIEEIIDIYLKEKEETFYKNRNGKISCCTYFNESALYDCDCGFDSASRIVSNICDVFSITAFPSNEELKSVSREFLSDKYKVVGVEKYCGEYLTGGNIIY